MASCLEMASLSTKSICLYQSSVDRGIKFVSIPIEDNKKDIQEPENDNDSGCHVINLEDDDENVDLKKLSVIPKEDIQRGSALDLDNRGSKIIKQSLSIIRKGSVPIDQMKQNIRLWQTSSQGRNVKSSGYGKEQPRAKMRATKLNRWTVRGKQNGHGRHPLVRIVSTEQARSK